MEYMKATVASITDVPEALRGEYEQKDGKFVLKLDGDYPGFVKAEDLNEANLKLTEFRDNNRGLHSQLEQFKSKYNGIDPDEHKKLKEKIAEFEKQGVKGGHDINSVVQKALSEAVGPLQQKLDEITVYRL